MTIYGPNRIGLGWMADDGKYLKTTHLQRFVASTHRSLPMLARNFIDEHGWVTMAKWKLHSFYGQYGQKFYVYRLDARSIRYMKRVEIIENQTRAA